MICMKIRTRRGDNYKDTIWGIFANIGYQRLENFKIFLKQVIRILPTFSSTSGGDHTNGSISRKTIICNFLN